MSLRKRQTPFVQVPSTTIRDKRLSFRSRGILAYLLDMPPDWDVRSEVIAAAGTEGREAVRTALHELGKHGYYRLERRRLLDGTFEMGTAVSEEPVPQWTEEYAEFGGKAVMVVQQEDGSYKVKRKDGTLTDDGFGPRDPGASGGTTGHTEDRFSGSGFTDSGVPGSGQSGPINRRETPDRETERETPPSSASPASGEQQGSLLGDDTPPPAAAKKPSRARKERTPQEQARFELSDNLATQWWERCDQLGIPNIRKGNHTAFPGFRRMLDNALAAGCTVNEIKLALDDLRDPFPSLKSLSTAISRRRGVAPLRPNGHHRPGNHLPVNDLDDAAHELNRRAFG
ncbi:hypothetical protein [Nonomuraea glycinis]|uniref:hypothetical protein n=1 Tax=Nonomuraea glycinis TaxID=2047744 RepID=UPI00339E9BDE